jgi:hypothetical protein
MRGGLVVLRFRPPVHAEPPLCARRKPSRAGKVEGRRVESYAKERYVVFRARNSSARDSIHRSSSRSLNAAFRSHFPLHSLLIIAHSALLPRSIGPPGAATEAEFCISGRLVSGLHPLGSLTYSAGGAAERKWAPSLCSGRLFLHWRRWGSGSAAIRDRAWPKVAAI